MHRNPFRSNLAIQIMALGKFRIKVDELGTKYEKLVKYQLVEVVGDEIQVLKPEPFAQVLLDKFKQKFNFSISSNAKVLGDLYMLSFYILNFYKLLKYI